MKKLLIATAALAMVAGTAQAQSSVQVYGVMDIGIGETKTSGLGNNSDQTRKTTTTGNGDGGLATSRLGFQGSEDLGGGLKANFRLEYDLTDIGAGGTALGARESWVSLQDAKLGELKIGRQITASHTVIVNALAGYANNTVGSVYSMGTGANTTTMPNENGIRPHNVFANRLIGYTSPSMNGVVVMAQYGENTLDTAATNDTNQKTTFTDMAVRYTAGKLNVGASRQTQKTQANTFDVAAVAAAANIGTGTIYADDLTAVTAPGGTIKYETTLIGGNYDFGVVQPFALYSERKLSTSIDTGTTKFKASEVGVRAPLSAKATVFVSMYDGDIKETGSSTVDLKGYQVGAIYNLSKRTALYAITGKQELDAAADGKVKTTGYNAGVRHSF